MFWRITTAIAVGAGLIVWLFGPAGTVTVGSSSVVYGYLGYVLSRGLVTRRAVSLGIAVAVLVLYWSALGGMLPDHSQPQISWLAHLGGFLSGIVVAIQMGNRRF
jgi:membrane associated rhomboid family serine protease